VDEEHFFIKLSKMVWVRYYNSRLITGEPKNITASLSIGIEADGHLCSRQTEGNVPDPVPVSEPMVAIDMGVVRLATLSEGVVIKPLHSFRLHKRKIRKLQKSVSRKDQAATKSKRKPSFNHAKARRKLLRQHKKIAGCHKDFLHKVSTDISKKHAIVVVEALKVKNMPASAAGTVVAPGKNVKAKSGLSKAIRDQDWYSLKVMLKNKLMMKGGQLNKV
jgi:putative transposase